MWVVIFNKFSGFDQLVPWYNLDYYMDIKKAMKVEYFEHIIRKFPLKSMEIEGKRVIVRYQIKYDYGADGLLKKEAFDMYLEREHTRKQELARFMAMREHSKKAMTKKEKREEQRLQEPEKPDLSFIEAKNYSDFMETVRYCVEHLAKLVILVISFDKPLGGYSRNYSLEFMYEHLKQVMDCPVNFSESFYIEDYAEVFESDEFPENSILLLENVNFEPGEVGCHNDADRNQTKIEFEEIDSFSNILRDYAPVYIFADRESLFSPFTSCKMLKNETVILAQPIHDELSTLAHTMITTKSNFTVVLGGPLSTLSLACLLNLTSLCDKIFLVGEIGLSLALIKLKIWSLGKLSYLKIHREIIMKVLQKLDDIENFAEVILPKGIIVKDKVEEETEEQKILGNKSPKKSIIQGSDNFLEADDKIKNVPLDGSYEYSTLPKDSDITEFNSETWDILNQAIEESEKVLFIENPLINYQFSAKIGGPLNDKTFNPVWLAPPPDKESKDKAKGGLDLSKLNKETPMQSLLKSVNIPKYEPVFSEKFKEIIVNINRRQQLKKLNIKADMGGDDPWHDYEHDLLITIFGSDLENLIEEMEFDIVELEKIEESRLKSEDKESQEKSDEIQDKSEKENSNQENEENLLEISQEIDEDFLNGQPLKKIYEVADFYIKDPEFVMKIISGEIGHGLNSIHEYSMTIPEDDNDFGYIKLI